MHPCKFHKSVHKLCCSVSVVPVTIAGNGCNIVDMDILITLLVIAQADMHFATL